MGAQSTITAQWPQAIATILANFAENGSGSKESLQSMLLYDPRGFCRAAVPILANASASPGFRFLAHLLLKHRLLAAALVDPECSTQEQAVAVLKSIQQIGSPVELELERALGAALRQGNNAEIALRIRRLMELLAEVSIRSLRLFQSALLAHPDATVRSKAVLLIRRDSKSPRQSARLLLDSDPRVQANAVEALWTKDESQSRDLLVAAAKSPHSRVAGNAAIGLYNIDDIGGIRLILEMAERGDPPSLLTAIWAMGKTEDARFSPYLKGLFGRSSGSLRAAVLRAMVRIQRRQREAAEEGQLEVRICETERNDKSTTIAVAVWSAREPNLSSLKNTDFAIWEGADLVRDYTVAIRKASAQMTVAFVTPRFLSNSNTYGPAVIDAFRRCVRFKRPDDLWRLDRYVIPDSGAEPPAAAGAADNGNQPYDESLLGPQVRPQRGFVDCADFLEKVIASPGPREKAAPDFLAAVDRAAEAMSKLTGERHILLFLDADGASADVEDRRLDKAAEFLRAERIAIHGIAPDPSDLTPQVRRFCESADGGSLNILAEQKIPDAVEHIYAQLLNRFEINYTAPPNCDSSDEGSVQVSSGYGTGRAVFTLNGSHDGAT